MAKATKEEYEIAYDAVIAVAKQICVKRGIDPDIPVFAQRVKLSNESPYVDDLYGRSLSSPAWQDHICEARANIKHALGGGSPDDPALPKGCVFLADSELDVSDNARAIIRKILDEFGG